MIVDFSNAPVALKPDEEVDAMSDGYFYLYMLDKDHLEWARQANRKGGLGLNPDQEARLASWFANAMCAMIDRDDAGYIKARLDSDHSGARS